MDRSLVVVCPFPATLARYARLISRPVSRRSRNWPTTAVAVRTAVIAAAAIASSA
jgi:hypothetical protein